MKNLLSVLGICLLIASCGPDYKSEVAKMQKERDSLMAQYDAKDSVINGYMQAINEIQTSIDDLTRQEQMLSRTGTDPEASTDAKTKIMNNIDAIRQLIDQNKKKLGALESKIHQNNIKIGELEKTVQSLNQQLAEKDSTVNVLNTNILALNGTITTMQGQIDTIRTDVKNKQKEISDKTTQLNTAYYTIGTYQQLRDKKVLSKQGGFLGLGKQPTVVSDFNQDAFTQIDVTNTKSISINSNGKDARLISTHPNGTYKLQKQNNKVTGIEITDPDKFWKASKYLVVVTE